MMAPLHELHRHSDSKPILPVISIERKNWRVDKREADSQSEDVKATSSKAQSTEVGGEAGVDIEAFSLKVSGKDTTEQRQAVERSFRIHKEKLRELDEWLPMLKEQIREFFIISKQVKGIFIQIDDLYHLRRTDQAFVVNLIGFAKTSHYISR